MIWQILAAALGGLVAHQTIHVTARISHGWRNLAEHAVGVVGAYPFFLIFRRSLRNGVDRSDSAYWLAFLWFGAGVALGWLVDTLRGE
jgi:hypothetical protein